MRGKTFRGAGLLAAWLVSVVKAVPWLVYKLPADHHVRSGLSTVVDLARARLTDPTCRRVAD